MLQRSLKDIVKRGERQLEPAQGHRYLTPFEEMDRFFDEAFRRPFFSLFSPRMRGAEVEEFLPPVDIFEDGESLVIKAEIPGIKKEDIQIDLTPDSITISGKKGAEEKVEQKDYLRYERSFGSFTRRFELPVETMSEKARASFKDGVLEVRIPKSATAGERVKKLTIE